MATFARLTGTSFTSKSFDIETRWPAACFYDDPRMRRTELGWLDYLGAMTAAELREFRDQHQLKGRDPSLDRILNSGWTGKVLIQCLEWEGYN
jgi:hypothetical protein